MHIRDSSLASFSGYICMFSFVMLLANIENLSAKAVYIEGISVLCCFKNRITQFLEWHFGKEYYFED